MSAKKLLVIDGNSILNRAFYGVRPMTTSDGRPTNALYGFINIILKQLEGMCPDAAAIAFDLREPTFRHKKCDFYKANRKGMPEELAAQLDGAKRAAEYLGLHVLSLAGFEADDILGSCAKRANTDKDTDYECYILTGDRDSYQLVDEKSFVLYCMHNETVLYDKQKIDETYGLLPSQLIDLKALMGDSSDNIPGVAGIGEKTAIKLIQQFGSLDNLYEKYADSDLSKGIKEKLQKDREMAYTSRFLAEICTDVPLPLSFSDLIYEGLKKNELLSLLREYELRALIKRLGLEQEKEKEKDSGIISFFDEQEATESDFTDYTEEALLPALSQRVAFFADLENGKIYIYDGKSYIVPLNDENLSRLTEGGCELIAYDTKELYRHLLSRAIPIDVDIFDVMLAQYVISPSAKRGIEDVLTQAVTDGYRISDEKQKYLCCVKAMYGMKDALCETIEKDGLARIYYEIELPLAKTLSRMEHEGFMLDTEGISSYGAVLEERLLMRQNNIYSLAGGQFNINSPKQLGEVLYKKLSLPTFKKNKSGPSTDAETLEKLRPYHPIINEILDYRVVSKLNSTYVEGLLRVCNDSSRRVHTTFKQALTLTGRLSSVEPNLQNIPIKQAEGRELRKFFIAKEGCVLIDADYSQIELRILAELSGDEVMCDTFRSGEDIHTTTACQVFGVKRDEITTELRKRAKAVNFGIVYGISDFSLAGDIGTSRAQAGEYIEKYFEKYPKIKSFLDESVEKAKKDGYVTTLFGRRRYIPELSASNKNMQNFGKRVAMNSPIQGTAADVIKLAMLGVEKALREELPEARLILQVHDELIVECPRADAERACEIVREQMNSCIKTHVPLEVSLSCGDSWFEAHI